MADHEHRPVAFGHTGDFTVHLVEDRDDEVFYWAEWKFGAAFGTGDTPEKALAACRAHMRRQARERLDALAEFGDD